MPADMVPVKCCEERHGDHEGQKVCHGLAHLHTGAMQPQRQEQHGRKEENALPAACQERRGRAVAEALIELIDERRDGQQRQHDAREAQRLRADAHDLRVAAEPAQDLPRKDGHDDGADRAEHRANEGRKPERLPCAAALSGAVVIACNGLEALPDADDEIAHEDIELVRDRDGRDGRVPVENSLHIEHGRSHTAEALPADSREERPVRKNISRSTKLTA